MTIDRPTVLIVDDNRMNIDLLVETLKSEYDLLVALDGETALEIVLDDMPDLILLDIMMPEMDGYEVCRRLKSDDRTKAIPIIFVTAKTQVDDEAKGLACGAVDYITKPISPAIVQARVRTHIALYDQNRLLEQKVREKTRELTRSRDAADKANKVKSEFLANISHELRTPLNHVMGLSSMLLELEKNEDQKELQRNLMEAAQRLTALFDRLLKLSQIEADLIKPSYTTFDLRYAMQQMAAMFRPYAKEKGLKLIFEMCDNVPTMVYGPPSEMRQILTNLIINAVRYTEEGDIRFSVAVHADSFVGLDPNTIMLQFTVADTGRGIPEEKQDAVFDSFVIGEDVMTKSISGSGLGLTIARALVEKLGGTIWLDSTPDQGTTVTLSLPVTIVEEESVSAG